MRLLQGDRRPYTVKSYDQKWLKFDAFKSQVQDDAGATRMCVLTVSSQTGRHLLGLPFGNWFDQRKIAPDLLECDQHGALETNLSTRHRSVGISSNWFTKALLNYKAPSCFNHNRSRRFLQSTCLILCSSGFSPTTPSTTFVCVRV